MIHFRRIVLGLCGFAFIFSAHSQSANNKPPAQNFVTVSFNDVVLRTAESQKALAALQTQFSPRQAQLEALNNEVETLRKQAESAAPKQTDAERAASSQALDRKEKQLQRQAEDFRTDSQAESQQIFQRVAQKVFAFLQTYAQQHGYTAVVERGSDASPIVWYADSSIDITDQVIKAFDAQAGAGLPQGIKPPTGSSGARPETSSPRQ